MRLAASASPLTVADPAGGGLRAVFDTGSGGPGPRSFSPSRLDAVETVFAMTIHKSQGSEFDHVTLLLPPQASRLLTRELAEHADVVVTMTDTARRRLGEHYGADPADVRVIPHGARRVSPDGTKPKRERTMQAVNMSHKAAAARHR